MINTNKWIRSWKTYTIAAGIIVIGTGIGVGVYFGVNTNNEIVTPELTDQDINSAIAKTKLSVWKAKGTVATLLESEINANFIQQQLTGDVKAAFNASLFSRDGKIMIQELEQNAHALSDEDLATSGTINTKFKYNYGSMIGQELNLTITVARSDDQMIDAINNGSYQLNDIEINTKATAIQSRITNDFFKGQLNEDYKTDFDDTIFNVNSIMVNDQKLVDKDLSKLGAINAKINYTYGSTTSAVDLKIKVVGIPNDENIWQKIIDTNYQITAASASSVNDLNAQIPNVIQSQLSELYQKYFEPKKFVSSILFKKKDDNIANLTDYDLRNPGVLTVWITFGYGSVIRPTDVQLTLTLT